MLIQAADTDLYNLIFISQCCTPTNTFKKMGGALKHGNLSLQELNTFENKFIHPG